MPLALSLLTQMEQTVCRECDLGFAIQALHRKRTQQGAYWSYAGFLGGILLSHEDWRQVITLWISKYSDPLIKVSTSGNIHILRKAHSYGLYAQTCSTQSTFIKSKQQSNYPVIGGWLSDLRYIHLTRWWKWGLQKILIRRSAYVI